MAGWWVSPCAMADGAHLFRLPQDSAQGGVPQGSITPCGHLDKVGIPDEVLGTQPPLATPQAAQTAQEREPRRVTPPQVVVSSAGGCVPEGQGSRWW